MNIFKSVLALVASSPAITAADIGRAHAPETIRDKAGWGRKTVNKMIEAGQLIRSATGALLSPEDDGLTQCELSEYAWQMRPEPHHNRAPHAMRGTPARKHWSRYTRTHRAFRCS